MDDTITIQTIATPVGTLGVALSPAGLGRLTFADEPIAACEAWAQRWQPQARPARQDRRVDLLAEQLNAYFAGALRVWTVPLDLRGTPFQLRVWRAVLAIPYGEVRSYSEIATAIGQPRAVRAVGAANGANPIPILVPCHRLIGKDGSLIKYGGGLALKRRLIELEGAPVRERVSG